MNQPLNIDGVLVAWGDRLFYPGNRIFADTVKPSRTTVA